MPKALNIPLGTKAHESLRLREEYKEKKRLFVQVIDLEKALLRLMSQAVPSMYLKPFRNRHSNAIESTIPDLLSHLLSTYGNVQEDDLLRAEATLRARVFDITEPLVVMYNEVDDLQELATSAGLPYSDNQIINLGIKLIKNMKDFEKRLTSWYDLPIINCT